jgi:hypothetical protein
MCAARLSISNLRNPAKLTSTLRWANAMYYIAHLALPAFVALIMVVSGTQIELSISWVVRVMENLANIYMIFAAPHWIWAAISGLRSLKGVLSEALRAFIFAVLGLVSCRAVQRI